MCVCLFACTVCNVSGMKRMTQVELGNEHHSECICSDTTICSHFIIVCTLIYHMIHV